MASLQVINVSDRGVTASRPVTLGPTIPFRGRLYYKTEDLIAKRGLKLTKPPSVKQAHANVRKQSGAPRAFPDYKSLQHQILIEAQSPLFTANEDGEFSSRSLTDWYVKAYCRLNYLKEC